MPIVSSKRKRTPDTRGNSRGRGFYHTKAWRIIRAQKLRRDPLCEQHKAAGITEPATAVHHRTPIAEGGSKRSPRNLESLCESCHNRHTAEEQAKCK